MKQLLAVIVVLVVGVVAFVMTRPGTFHVERRITIHAPPDAVYAELADFHAWGHWSPWEQRDLAMRRTYAGDSYSWQGNREVGSGTMTFTERTAPSRVGIKLAFTAPFASESRSMFVLASKDAETEVVWSMDGGGDDFMSKAAVTFMSMEKAIGPDYEAGLKNLKAVVETVQKPPER
jgi:hypothetical protein